MVYHPFRHLGLKALSVGLAALLWFVVARDQVVERSLRVPLEYQSIPEALEIVGDPPGMVDVRVRGASSALGRLQPGDVVAVLNLQGARPGSRIFHLLTGEVRVPFGIEVTQVAPPTVAIDLEPTGRRVVPVLPALEGEPAEGFVAGSIRVDPPSVEVVGPESRLAKLTTATTEPVSLAGARTTVRDRVTVGVNDGALRLTELRAVLVTVEIEPAPVERSIGSVPVGVRNIEDDLRAVVTPSTVTVVVRGSRDRVASIAREDIDVWVDLSSLGRGRYTLDVRGEGGQEFGFVRTEPASVQVRLVPES